MQNFEEMMRMITNEPHVNVGRFVV